ncbi:hypothetical protein N0V85_007745 [Neurospora sp. IMI 360204]|nr:hypothetical protein N0V85_007745 [Neurospora sp. IMI 360204]
MEEQVFRLVDRAWGKYLETPKDQRLLIAIAGIPGSGKTTLSQIIANRLNNLHATNPPYASLVTEIAIALPMDGFHLTRAQLSAMPYPELAHARRGAEFTFDGQGFYELVKELRQPMTEESQTVWAPSFDHALKDPVEKGIEVAREVRVVIFEGNYLLLDQKPWSDASKLMDLKFFVRVPFPVARKRLVKRHLAAGIASTPEEADKRAVENDLVNGEMIEKLLREDEVDEVVESMEDGKWVHT